MTEPDREPPVDATPSATPVEASTPARAAATDEGEAPGSTDPLSRPLPSVDMPLLRGQLRAVRTRQLGALAILGALGVAALGFALVRYLVSDDGDEVNEVAAAEGEELTGDFDLDELSGEDLGELDDLDLGDGFDADAEEEVAEAEAAEAAAESEATTTSDGARHVETTFGRSPGFRPGLIRAGLSDAEAGAIETALRDVIDFRRCQPTDRLVFERDEAGELVLFRYHDEAASFAEVRRDDAGELAARRVERSTETVTVAREGVVRSSLGDAVTRAGLGRETVGVFIEVFDGKIRFATQARAGDRFRVLVDEERIEGRFHRFGQVRAMEYISERVGTLRAYYYEPRGGRANWFDEDGREIRGGWLRVPCRYDRISSPFNPRRMHPILRRVVPHLGTDFAASTGTPVIAAADGEVTWAGPRGANGNLVGIRHEGGYQTFYAHLHRIQRGIRPGVHVDQGDPIGAVGTTGRSTGPHLHFGLKRNGEFVDAMEVINGPGRRLPAAQLGRFRRTAADYQRQLDALGSGADEGSADAPDPEGETS